MRTNLLAARAVVAVLMFIGLAGCAGEAEAPPESAAPETTASASADESAEETTSAEPSDGESEEETSADSEEPGDDLPGECSGLTKLEEGSTVSGADLAPCLDLMIRLAGSGKMTEMADPPPSVTTWSTHPEFKAHVVTGAGEQLFLSADSGWMTIQGHWIAEEGSDPMSAIVGPVIKTWRELGRADQYSLLIGGVEMRYAGTEDVAADDGTVRTTHRFDTASPFMIGGTSFDSLSVWADMQSWLVLRQTSETSLGGVSAHSDRMYSDYGQIGEIPVPTGLPD